MTLLAQPAKAGRSAARHAARANSHIFDGETCVLAALSDQLREAGIKEVAVTTADDDDLRLSIEDALADSATLPAILRPVSVKLWPTTLPLEILDDEHTLLGQRVVWHQGGDRNRPQHLAEMLHCLRGAIAKLIAENTSREPNVLEIALR